MRTDEAVSMKDGNPEDVLYIGSFPPDPDPEAGSERCVRTEE